MDSRTEQHDPDGQQVMGAQSTGAAPRPREPGTETMEGEANGPDYGAQRVFPPRLPNGVPGAGHGSPVGVEIESLPSSPMVNAGARERQAFSGEAWPAQPASVEDPRPDGGRTVESTPAALRWMHRLGDFLKSHTSMETLTSVTRQQIVGQGSNGSGFLVHQQVHHTASRPGTPTASPPIASSAAVQLSAESNPPLFGRSASRAMEAWAQQAPLLYPAQRRDAATDGGSSGSIPRELVEEEVKRQVEQALKSQQRGMNDLQEENRRLREQLEAGTLSVPERDRAYTSSSPYLSVIGLTPAVSPYLSVIGLIQAVSPYLSVIGLTTAVTPYLSVIGLIQAVSPYLSVIGLTTAVTPYLSVIGLIQAVSPYLSVIGLTTAVTPYLSVIELIQAVSPYLSVIGLSAAVCPYLSVIGLTAAVTPYLSVIGLTAAVTPYLSVIGLTAAVTPYLSVIGLTAAVTPYLSVIGLTAAVTPYLSVIGLTAAVTPYLSAEASSMMSCRTVGLFQPLFRTKMVPQGEVPEPSRRFYRSHVSDLQEVLAGNGGNPHRGVLRGCSPQG